MAVEDYDELPSYRHDYEIGTLVVHSGMELHAIPPEEIHKKRITVSHSKGGRCTVKGGG